MARDGAGATMLPVAAMSGKERTEVPPTAAQLPGAAPTAVQPPNAAPTAARAPTFEQQQPCAATSQVEAPPLFDQILQAYRAHDFDPRKSLHGDFVLADGFSCEWNRDGSLKLVIPEDAKL